MPVLPLALKCDRILRHANQLPVPGGLLGLLRWGDAQPSFTEILSKANLAITSVYGVSRGAWVTTTSFFGGISLTGIIDRLVPKAKNPHKPRSLEDLNRLKAAGPLETGQALNLKGDSPKLLRTGMFTALAIAIHNFPERMVTFLATLQDVKVGIAIAVAIALHNIPEGISVSVLFTMPLEAGGVRSFSPPYPDFLNRWEP